MENSIDTTKVQGYIVMEQFLINLNNGKDSGIAKVGDTVRFDGLVAEHKGRVGQAKSLASAIRAGWMSLPDSDSAAPSTQETPEAVTSKESARTVLVESTDDDIVAQTRQAADGTNKRDIYIEKEGKRKVQVIQEDQRVVFVTDHDGKKATAASAAAPEDTKTTVTDASGQEGEVVSTRGRATPAKQTTDLIKTASLEGEGTVSGEDVVVKEVTGAAATSDRTDVGSSTQTKTGVRDVTDLKDMPQADTLYEGGGEDLLNQGARVVSKTRDVKLASSTDGVEITTTVGSSQEFEAPTAKTSASQEGIILPKATIAGKPIVKKAATSAPADTSWREMHWTHKVKFANACTNTDTLTQMQNSKLTPVVQKAVSARLQELV